MYESCQAWGSPWRKPFQYTLISVVINCSHSDLKSHPKANSHTVVHLKQTIRIKLSLGVFRFLTLHTDTRYLYSLFSFFLAQFLKLTLIQNNLLHTRAKSALANDTSSYYWGSFLLSGWWSFNLPVHSNKTNVAEYKQQFRVHKSETSARESEIQSSKSCKLSGWMTHYYLSKHN